ncbi:GSDA2 protein, partial [Atractosteus spatula]|nr:GSDA2 protein [Atractosteus spatula]
MFKKLTKDIVNELDPHGYLHPVQSLYDSHKFEVLTVVKKHVETRLLLWSVNRFVPTGIKLDCLLAHGDTVDIGKTTNKLGSVKMKQEGTVDVKGPVILSVVDGEAGVTVVSCSSVGSTAMEVEAVNINDLHMKLEERTFNHNHWLMKKLKNRKVSGLYVVSEILRAKTAIDLLQNLYGDATLSFCISNLFTIGGKVKGEREKELKVEAGTALAFRLLEIKVDDDGLLSDLEEEKKSRSFFFSDGVSCIADDAKDFPAMKRKVEKEFQEFKNLDSSSREHIWKHLSQMLTSGQALSTLDSIMEERELFAGDLSALEAVPGEVRSSVNELLSIVGLDACDPNELCSPLGLLVSAFNELEGFAVDLICDLTSEARKEQLKLVQWLVEQVYSGSSLTSGWSEQFSQDSLRLAKQVLGSCGLCLDEGRLHPSLGTPLNPDVALLSFYIALQGLESLLEQ